MRRMATIRTLVWLMAAPPTGLASSRILFPASTISCGSMEYPYRATISTNTPIASANTGSMGYSPVATAAEAKTTVDYSDDDPRRDLDADRAVGKGGATADAKATSAGPGGRRRPG